MFGCVLAARRVETYWYKPGGRQIQRKLCENLRIGGVADSKLDIQEILERFALIASLPMEEAVGYTALCSDAAGELTRRLRGTVSENNASRLEPAAASLAYYRYAMYQAANAEDFTVGDITVASGRDDKVRLAREVWMEAEREIADLLSDYGFVFRGVRV